MRRVVIVPIRPTQQNTRCHEPHEAKSARAQFVVTTVGDGAETVNLCVQHLLRRAAVDPEVKKALGQIADIPNFPEGDS